MAWVTPVTNRTSGTTQYTNEDLNRVGTDVACLADLLNGYGYSVTVTAKADWALGYIPRAADMAAYIADIAAIKEAFYGTQAIPSTANNMTAVDANNIEKLLAEVERYISNMVAAFRHCGTFYAGEDW